MSLSGKRFCGRNGLLVEVNPHKGASCLRGDSQRRSARAAGNIKECFPGGKVKPVEEHILLAGGHPAVLSYVFAKSFAADFRVKFGLKVAIVSVVEGDTRLAVRLRGWSHRILR